MSAADDTTLAKIATLASREEIEGWRLAVRITGRAMLPGEAAALMAREREIGGMR